MSTASTAPRRQSFRARGVPKHLRDYVLEEHTQIHPCSPPPELDGAAETLEGGVDMLDPEGSTGSQDMTEGQEQEKEEREEEESKDGSSDSSDSSSLDDERTVSALDRQRQRQMRRTDGHRKLKPVQLDRHGDHRVLRAPYDSNSSTSADLKRPSSISSILFTSVVPSTGLIFARVRTPPTSPRPASTAVAEYFPGTVASELPTPPVETSAYLSINHSLSLDYPDQNPVEYCNPTPHFPWTYDESLTVSGGLGHIPYRPNRQLTPDHEGASEDREGEEREESASDGREEKPVDEAEADKVMQSWLDLNGV